MSKKPNLREIYKGTYAKRRFDDGGSAYSSYDGGITPIDTPIPQYMYDNSTPTAGEIAAITGAGSGNTGVDAPLPSQPVDAKTDPFTVQTPSSGSDNSTANAAGGALGALLKSLGIGSNGTATASQLAGLLGAVGKYKQSKATTPTFSPPPLFGGSGGSGGSSGSSSGSYGPPGGYNYANYKGANSSTPGMGYQPRTPMPPNIPSYYSYGQGPEAQFYGPTTPPVGTPGVPAPHKHGGSVKKFAAGGFNEMLGNRNGFGDFSGRGGPSFTRPMGMGRHIGMPPRDMGGAMGSMHPVAPGAQPAQHGMSNIGSGLMQNLPSAQPRPMPPANMTPSVPQQATPPAPSTSSAGMSGLLSPATPPPSSGMSGGNTPSSPLGILGSAGTASGGMIAPHGGVTQQPNITPTAPQPPGGALGALFGAQPGGSQTANAGVGSQAPMMPMPSNILAGSPGSGSPGMSNIGGGAPIAGGSPTPWITAPPGSALATQQNAQHWGLGVMQQQMGSPTPPTSGSFNLGGLLGSTGSPGAPQGPMPFASGMLGSPGTPSSVGAPTSGVAAMAEGGALAAATGHGSSVSRHVQGPGDGTSDSIPARLANGEYVIDAQTVSMLGNGDNGSGAKVLDAMRRNIRQHKGQALAKGQMAPDAKPIHKYMSKS
jgi:hypothetical protein